ncbi:MAG: YciI family protein [Actinobacteria bacterium]|nr:YciI family protein [Actinomycetota bacterium]
MRFMMFMYPEIEEQDWLGEGSTSAPSLELVEAMSRYNEELRRAGMLLSLDGLHPPGSDGATVSFDAEGAATVTDGPFAETKEVVGGYWLIQARSKEEAVEWARRCPCQSCRIELRRVQEMDDFPPEIQQAAEAGE